MWRFAVLAFGAAILTSCATLNEDECMTADWRSIGYVDGSEGRPISRLDEHRRACAKYGVAPDLASYRTAREQGLLQYCKPDVAFRVGSDGETYHNVCPPQVEGPFLTAYHSGRRLYDLESGLDTVRGDIRRLENEIEDLEEELRRVEQRLVNETDRAVRQRLATRMRELSREIGEAQQEMLSLEREQGRREIEVENYRATVWY